jgi:hypothetical protein
MRNKAHLVGWYFLLILVGAAAGCGREPREQLQGVEIGPWRLLLPADAECQWLLARPELPKQNQEPWLWRRLTLSCVFVGGEMDPQGGVEAKLFLGQGITNAQELAHWLTQGDLQCSLLGEEQTLQPQKPAVECFEKQSRPPVSKRWFVAPPAFLQVWEVRPEKGATSSPQELNFQVEYAGGQGWTWPESLFGPKVGANAKGEDL